MCGIVGFLSPGGLNGAESEAMVRSMAASLAHRGPDDAGTWVDSEAGIALGHRRLAILDLSPRGHQPMVSPGGRFVVILNGEIYNHMDLRSEMNGTGIVWKGTSDTETLVAGIELWGLESTLRKSVGMFALAVWDRKERKLMLARDRLGEKPLYYGWQGTTLLFGSELKALKTHPDFDANVDRNVIPLYMRYGYIPSPFSIYAGIHKLSPGTFVTIPEPIQGNQPKPIAYWSLRHAAETGQADPFQGDDDAAADALEACLKRAVALQSIADVPLGAFLSGGVDSSLIVALMQEHSRFPIKTFTIGFRESGYNEAEYAKAVARHLGTEHTEWYVSADDALELIPNLPSIYDEPFGDSSQLPTLLVSQMTRRHVTVSLSGDAGDELFGGYDRYRIAQKVHAAIGRIPRFARHIVGSGLGILPTNGVDSLMSPFLSGKNQASPGERVRMLSALMTDESEEKFYRTKISQWKDPHRLVPGATEPLTNLADPTQKLTRGGLFERMMYHDSMSYLPDDILVKTDRAAMSVGLETRVPMLDHRVVEFAWRLPLHMKVRDGHQKWLLKQVLFRRVPRELIERPKAGFAVPADEWIRGPLREWAEDLLSEQSLRHGFLNPKIIRRKFHDHLNGRYGAHGSLWPVLMFQAWIRSQAHR